MKSRTFCRRVARHGLILGGTEAHHLQEAFARPPGPPGPQKQTKRKKNVKHIKKLFFVSYFLPYFPKHAKHNGVLTSTLKNYQRLCRPQSYGFPSIPICIPIDSQVFPWLSGKGWWPSKLRISRYSHKYSYRFPSIPMAVR